MNLNMPKTLAILLQPDLPVALQLRWALHVAAARRLDLLILHRVESHDEHVAEVTLGEPPAGEATGIIHEIQRVIEESPALQVGPRESDDAGEEDAKQQVIYIRLKLVYFTSLSSLRHTLLDELANPDIVLFTQARETITDLSDVDLIRERRLFLRYIPCEFVICHGLAQDTTFSRILVATEPGSNGRAALQLAVDLAATAGRTLTALHVNPDVGEDAARVGERRLARLLTKTLGEAHPGVDRRVVVHDQVPQAIRQVWEEGNHDVVVVGSSGQQLEASVGTRLGKGVTVIMVSSISPLANRFKEFLEEGLQQIVPQIPREERVSLVDRVQSSAAWNFDFLALMVLSTTMAAIGLIQNSGAVVIGAMLVAPLMTPLLGLGLALVQGNPVLARLSLRSVVFGLGVSLLGGLLVGLSSPSLEEPTREMLARGGPGLLDISVAFAAGLAAAYAQSRPGLIAALPGVAIAAALVPPIATSGLALSLGDFSLAIGALLLFVINMFTIVMASMISLWMVGIRNIKQSSRWTRLAGSVVIVGVCSLAIFLTLQPHESELTEKLPVGLLEAVQQSVGKTFRFESLAVAYDELGVQLNVQVAGNAPAPDEMATAVRTLISDHYDEPVRVRLLTRIVLDLNPEE